MRCLVEQVGSVVLADGGSSVFAEGIEEADGVSFAGELPDVGLVGPVEGGYLIVGGQVAAVRGHPQEQPRSDGAAGRRPSADRGPLELGQAAGCLAVRGAERRTAA
jgi:hypothetical protein